MTATKTSAIHLRPAVPQDVPVLQQLIEASVRGLQTEDYTPAQMEGALKTVFGVDSQLIADGTYIVAHAPAVAKGNDSSHTSSAPPLSDWVIVGCGGWSKRKTLFGSDHWTGREDALLDRNAMPPKFAPFLFIRPGRARASAA